MQICGTSVGRLLYVVGLAVVSYCFIAFMTLQSDAEVKLSQSGSHRFLSFLSHNGSDRLVTTIRDSRPSSMILNKTDEGKINSTEARAHLPTLQRPSLPASETRAHSPTLPSVPEAEAHSLTLSSVPKSRADSLTLSSLPKAGAHVPTLSSVPEARAHLQTLSSLPAVRTRSPTLSSVPETRAHSRTLWSVLETCKEKNCAEFLSQSEKSAIRDCKSKVVQKIPEMKMQNGTCRFLPGVGRSPVMLVSAEGSGSTWLRGLLEKATGVCTGFRWCDAFMRVRGFVGEGVYSGKVLVIKTHDNSPKSKWNPTDFKSAVFLLRNPAHSLIAERNRRVTNCDERRKNLPRNDSHTKVAFEDLFVHGCKDWNWFSKVYMHEWRMRLTNWVLNNDKYPVHVVRYENLQKDRLKEVEKVLDFLHFSYKHEDIVSALQEDYSTFQRSHHSHFKHYSAEQKENIRSTILNMTTLADIRGKANLLRLNEYLEVLPHID